MDYQVQADASGHLTCHVECRRPPLATTTLNVDGGVFLLRRKIVVRLYNDEQLTADGDVWRQGQCLWTASHELVDGSEKNKRRMVGVTLSGDINGADLHLWSAETPHLHTLTITLEAAAAAVDGETPWLVQQSESCRVGFRTIDILDGIVHVNGQRITVCGINRHEHDPDHGKVVSLERMKQDVCLLK